MTFANKIWLLFGLGALVMFALLVSYAWRARGRQIKQFASERLLSDLLFTYSFTKATIKNCLIGASILIIAIALARPQWGYTLNETKSKGIDVLFVIDTSKSMLAEDLKPNRLKRAKLAILDFIENLQSDRVGITAFAGNAFLQCPLTLEYDAFRLSLDAIDTNIIPRGGTNIGAAIEDAQAAFSSQNNHKIMILITDGEDLEGDGIAAAQRAAENDVTIYTIGVGTPNGGLIPIAHHNGRVQYLKDENGKVVNSKLDETTLQAIANATGGFYANLGPAGLGLQQVYEHGLKNIPQQDLASRMQRIPIEHFQWPLGLAIFLLFIEPLISNRRSSAKLNAPRLSAAPQVTAFAVGLLLLGIAVSAYAAPGDKALQTGDYATAVDKITQYLAENPQDARMRYNLGVALYQSGEYAQAIESWLASLATEDTKKQQDAFYNMGNAHYRLGQSLLDAAKRDQSFFAIFSDTPALTEQAAQAAKQALKDNDLNARKASWEKCEAIVEKIKQGIQQANAFRTATQKPLEHWRNALQNYASALELNPENEDAQFNRDFVQAKQTTLLDENEAMQGTIEDQKKLQKELENLIAALKAPTPMVIEAEKLAQMLIERGQYLQAYSVLSQTAQQDPTAEKYADKQNRTGEIVSILEQPQPTESQ